MLHAKRLYLFATIGCLLATPVSSADNLRTLGPLTDHAVLQRDAKIPLSGVALPGAALDVRFAGEVYTTFADTDGEWRIDLPPRAEGGPYKLTVTTETDRLEYTDILVGDVWLCSGQSNMEYPIYRALNPDTTIAGPHSDRIRMYAIPHQIALSAKTRFEAAPVWQIPTSETVGSYSAVCYLTAQNRHADDNVPIGLIDASWGGSQIEAWLSSNSLSALGGFETELNMVKRFRTAPDEAMRTYGDHWEAWWREETGKEPWRNAGPFQAWMTAPAEMQDWNTYGDPSLIGFTGRVWFAHTFDLTEVQAQQDATLSLGVIDEHDVTWINGAFVGTTESWSVIREYPVAAENLRPGTNVIITLAQNGYGAGGMMGPNEEMHLSLLNGEKIPVDNNWVYQIAERLGAAPSPPWAATSGYSTIYNGMVAPLGNWPMRKGIWYQGESNTGKAATYEQLLQALTDQWRTSFGEALEIAIVQLPGFGPMPNAPAASGWSDVREAQRQVALNNERTGLVVSIDAGDRWDIHPPNKQVIAERAAQLFRTFAGKAVGAEDGLGPSSVSRSSDGIVIAMPTDRINIIGGSNPIGFQLCSAPDVCVWASAVLDENRISLTSPVLIDAKLVRYCWGEAPICNLFDENDVPIVPFQETVE